MVGRMRWWLAFACLARVASAGPYARMHPRAAPGSVRNADVAEQAARAFVAAHAAELGVRPADLVVVANELDGETRSVGFRQTARGVAVIGAQIGFVFRRDRLFAVLPHLAANVVVPRDARAVLRVAPGDDRAVEIDDRAEATIYRDAATHAELRRVPKQWDATGTLQFDVGLRYATGPRVTVAVPEDEITVNGAPMVTGDDGTFSWPGIAAASVMPGLAGTLVAITNQAGALVTTTLTAQDGLPAVWSLASDELGDAQLSAFIYTGIAKAKAREVNPAVDAFLDMQLPVFVNETGSCNATANPNELHFYRADAQCQNTARVADVVYHEFGHVLHYHSVIAGVGMFEQQLSEGLADFGAANLNDDSGVGRGLYYNDVPARDIDPYGTERHWPEDIDADPHVTGEIVSGALWDLRKALIAELGHDAGIAQTEAIFTGIMQRAVDIPSSYEAALVADDDDGDLSNGTPHFCAIYRAFGVHGLAPAGFATTTVGTPSIADSAIALTVTTPADVQCPAPQVTSITVTWQRGDGVPAQFELAGGGDSGIWAGQVPRTNDGSIVHYHVDAALDDGSNILMPDNPADPDYVVFDGSASTIECEHMDHDPAWTQVGNDGDQWTWGRPGETSYDRAARTAYSGDDVLGTGLVGTGVYHPAETTSITTPAYTVSKYEVVHLQFWRWLTVEDATYDQAEVAVNGTPIWTNASSVQGTLDHVDKEWRFQDFDVSPLVAGGSAQITWSLASDDTNQFGGWTLDDVCLVATTRVPRCGDGFVDPGEQCDDGNNVSGDGCSATCDDDFSAGGGGCDASGGASAWSIAMAAAALLAGGRRGRSRRGCRNKPAGRAGPRRS
jgi:cysteine-rich repeat protein